ncbi:sulfatase [Flammeovirga sp. OC4]|uniref:sulfatase family protein n=1 Tax=Flammeovirga sp. OC4 TaxID=1382345 RepID=UPI0006944309|nr:sulfatase-like hydrolase/transferase [Flammeovirga sp. OC4]
MKKSILLSFILLSILQLAQAKTPPNVVLIFVDDMGWGDVGYHGVNTIHTPQIDQLANEGVYFSQGYVTASICGPSRAGLITGKYQQRFGCFGNSKHGIPNEEKLLFHYLKEQGYQTASIGKWHLGEGEGRLMPNERGVDYFYGFLGGSHDYTKSAKDENVKRSLLKPIYENGEIQPPIQNDNGYLTDLFTEKAISFIDKNKENPFCLYLAYNAVHHPWQVPQKYVDALDHLEVGEERKHFAGMVYALDVGIGQIREALKENGIDDNTIIFFISDNGTPAGQGFKEPRRKKRGETTMSSPGPFNGFKGSTYEGGIRIPFIAHYPKHFPENKHSEVPVISLDVLPTILNQIGNGLGSDELEGKDLLELIDGEEERPLFWARDGDIAVRYQDWKLSINNKQGSGAIELYDLKNDPGEWKDIASSNPEKVKQLLHFFQEWDQKNTKVTNHNGLAPKYRAKIEKYLEELGR